MFITPEMQTQKFLKDPKNFYTTARGETCIDDIKELRIGTEVYVKIIQRGRECISNDPFKIVGYEVHQYDGCVWWPCFDGLIEELKEMGSLYYWSVVVQMPARGSTFSFNSIEDYNYGQGAQGPSGRSVSYTRCRSYAPHNILRPQKPPLKQMLTSVNLHRLAHGKSVLAKDISEDELQAIYKKVSEHDHA